MIVHQAIKFILIEPSLEVSLSSRYHGVGSLDDAHTNSSVHSKRLAGLSHSTQVFVQLIQSIRPGCGFGIHGWLGFIHGIIQHQLIAGRVKLHSSKSSHTVLYS